MIKATINPATIVSTVASINPMVTFVGVSIITDNVDIFDDVIKSMGNEFIAGTIRYIDYDTNGNAYAGYYSVDSDTLISEEMFDDSRDAFEYAFNNDLLNHDEFEWVGEDEDGNQTYSYIPRK